MLIAPHALLNHSWESGVFPVDLTGEQVRKSPAIYSIIPVARQHEERLADYHPKQPYLETAFNPGHAWGTPPTSFSAPEKKRQRERPKKAVEDPHLRSYHKVTGYHIHATDGDIGHVHDFIFNDQTWQVSYLLVDTHNWIGGNKVLVAVHHIKEIQWENSKVGVDLTIDTIKNSVAIDVWDYIIPEGDKAESRKHSFQLQEAQHKV